MTAATDTAIWRDPDEESHIYPGLCLHDGRVAGSITAGCTRLPLWAFVADLVAGGYKQANESYDIADCGLSEAAVAGFLYDLLEARGEFGRLLLTLAEVERREGERQDAWAQEQGGGLIEIDLNDRNDPPPWWALPAERQLVRDQLQRCVAALDAEPSWPPR